MTSREFCIIISRNNKCDERASLYAKHFQRAGVWCKTAVLVKCESLQSRQSQMIIRVGLHRRPVTGKGFI